MYNKSEVIKLGDKCEKTVCRFGRLSAVEIKRRIRSSAWICFCDPDRCIAADASGCKPAAAEFRFIDALFTATSAVCVTRLVVVDTGAYFSTFGHSVIISLIQIMAVGIMTMATLMALVMRRKIQLRERLLIQESLNQLTMSGVVRLTKK